jgi:hypothetical protein
VEEGGRQTPLVGEYRPNWSIESDDPKRQAGGPIFIDDDQLRPGEEGDASLIPFTRETWEAVTAGTSLTGFEGNQVVARAVVLSVVTPE